MAAFINLYPNLPGHLVEFKDGGMVLRNDSTPQQTDSVLLLGTATDGPVGEPVAIDMTTIEALYGSDAKANGKPNGATLVKAAKALYNTGVRDIRCMRITGSSAGVTLAKANAAVKRSESKEEFVGVGKGNGETVLTLSQTKIDATSVRVYVNGIELSALSYKLEAQALTVKAGACEAKANVQVVYNYKDERENVLNSVESATAEGVPFITKAQTQVATLTDTPLEGSLRLYADGVQVLTDAYSLSVKEVTLKSEFFPLGSNISAYYVYVVTDVVKPTLRLESKYGGNIYNQCVVSVSKIVDKEEADIGRLIKLTKPLSKRSQVTETPLTYSSLDYPSFGELIDAINSDENNNVFIASTEREDSNVADLEINVSDSNTAGAYFMGGEDGITTNKVALYEALSGIRDREGYVEVQGAYQLLENYKVDWVVPLGVYADDTLPGKYKDFAYELALYCAIVSHSNKTTHGVISTRPCENTSLSGIQTYIERLMKLNNLYYLRDEFGNYVLGTDGKPMDLGMYLSVLSGPEVAFISYTLGNHYIDPSVPYVGLNAIIPVQQAPTNKVVAGASGVRFRLSNKQHNEILGKRMVTFKVKNETGVSASGSVCATDGATAAAKTSDYTRLSTVKIVRETVDQLREVAEPFIGNPNTVEQRNALSSALSKRLGILQTNGILNSYDFTVISSQTDQKLGKVGIELSLQAPQELRRITTVVSLSATV